MRGCSAEASIEETHSTHRASKSASRGSEIIACKSSRGAKLSLFFPEASVRCIHPIASVILSIATPCNGESCSLLLFQQLVSSRAELFPFLRRFPVEDPSLFQQRCLGLQSAPSFLQSHTGRLPLAFQLRFALTLSLHVLLERIDLSLQSRIAGSLCRVRRASPLSTKQYIDAIANLLKPVYSRKMGDSMSFVPLIAHPDDSLITCFLELESLRLVNRQQPAKLRFIRSDALI